MTPNRRRPDRRAASRARAAVLCAVLAAGPGIAADAVVPYRADGDAIAAPLTPVPGDPARGRTVVTVREIASCTLCHAVPGAPDRFMGDIGPPLEGVGNRLTPAQLRLRLVDSTRINPASVMPAYHRVEGLTLVAKAYQGKPVLSAQDIEDAVAWLSTLKQAP